MMKSHFAARVLSVLSVLAISILFVTVEVGVHPFVGVCTRETLREPVKKLASH